MKRRLRIISNFCDRPTASSEPAFAVVRPGASVPQSGIGRRELDSFCFFGLAADRAPNPSVRRFGGSVAPTCLTWIGVLRPRLLLVLPTRAVWGKQSPNAPVQGWDPYAVVAASPLGCSLAGWGATKDLNLYVRIWDDAVRPIVSVLVPIAEAMGFRLWPLRGLCCGAGPRMRRLLGPAGLVRGQVTGRVVALRLWGSARYRVRRLRLRWSRHDRIRERA